MNITINGLVGLLVGSVGVVMILASAGYALMGMMSLQQEEGCSRWAAFWRSISLVAVLLVGPSVIIEEFRGESPDFVTGFRIGILAIAAYCAPVVCTVVVSLWTHRKWSNPKGPAPGGYYLDALPGAFVATTPVWMAAALVAAAIAGAAYGGGGSVLGFIAAFAFNPLWWLAFYFISRRGSLICPHCRRLMWSKRTDAVGTAQWCGYCQHYSRKDLRLS